MWWMAAERAEGAMSRLSKGRIHSHLLSHKHKCIATCYYVIAATNTSSLPVDKKEALF